MRGDQVIIPQLQERFERKRRMDDLFASPLLAAGVLLLAVILAFITANIGLYDFIQSILRARLAVFIGIFGVGITVEEFINDFLMSIFFLMVGIELKYEVTVGELQNVKAAVVPMAAAVGGVVCASLISFTVLSICGESTMSWAVPISTDLALALGVVALAGKRMPHGMKVFLTTASIADDLLTITILALYYNQGFSFMWLCIALLCFALLCAFNFVHQYRLLPYLSVGILMWIALYASGIHASFAGVLLALAIPARPMVNLHNLPKFAQDRLQQAQHALDPYAHAMAQSQEFKAAVRELARATRQATPPLIRVQHVFANFSAYVVLPLFAFVNAQVQLHSYPFVDIIASPIVLSIILGLLIGKPLGLYVVSKLIVLSGLGTLPQGCNWQHVKATALISGVGFTMSVMIASISLIDPLKYTSAQLGAVIAMILGLCMACTYCFKVLKPQD